MRYPVAALGATQLIGYGTLFYAFPIAVPAIAAEHGFAPAAAYGALSAGLLAGALIAPATGRALDRLGAARVMAWGSAAAAVLFGLMALAPLGPWGLAAVAAGLQMVAVLVTYEPAFAVLVARRGAGARRAITQLTLIGGLASTAFWPLTGLLVEAWGWRATALAYGLLNLGVALPLHAALARPAPAAEPPPRPAPLPAPPSPAAELAGEAARRGFWLLAASFTLTGIVMAALSVHMVPVLQALALGGAAYLVSMAMGPAQTLIRLVDALFWQGFHPVTAALLSGALVPLAALVLLAAGPGSLGAALAFAVLFGAGQGLSSIVRGSVPLALFGPLGYGALLGRLAAIRQFASALAPLGFALALDRLPVQAALALAAGLGVLALAPLWALRGLVRRA